MNGDADGFEAWYGSRHRRLLASMVALGADADVASEVTDEAFSRALLHWARVSGMASPDGWLYRVAVHELRRHHRRRVAERRLWLRVRHPAPVPRPVEPFADLIRTLPPRQRAMIVLRYVADLGEAEIAEALGVARSTVSTSLSVARRRLVADLTDDPISKEVPGG